MTVWELVQTMSQLPELKLFVLYFSVFYSLIWNSRLCASSKNTCTFKFLDKNIYFICYEKSADAPTWTEQKLKTWCNTTLTGTSISKRVPKQPVPCFLQHSRKAELLQPSSALKANFEHFGFSS